jgi:hypothetical protein
LSGEVDANGGRSDSLEGEAVGGDDAVVEDVVDVGLGGEAADAGSVVLGCGLNGGDSEVLVSNGETGACRGDSHFGVARNGGIAIEDEVAVRGDAGGVDLRFGERGKKEREEEGWAKAAEAGNRWNRTAKD